MPTQNTGRSRSLERREEALEKQELLREQQEWKLEEQAAKSMVKVVAAIAESAAVIVSAHEYRNNLRAIVETLKADQSIRHSDVQIMIEMIRTCGHEMSQEVKDQFFLGILGKLTAGAKKLELPSPR